MRCKIQECGNYQPCRIFIKSTLSVEITMSSVKTQAAIFGSKFGVNQHNKVTRKQQSLGLKPKKYFQMKRQKRNILLYTIELIQKKKKNTEVSSRTCWQSTCW